MPPFMFSIHRLTYGRTNHRNHPIWSNRDHSVPSAGHASSLLCAMLHLTGVKVAAAEELLGKK
jgi:transketolase